MPLIGLMQQGEQVPWVVKRFVDFLSNFGLEVRDKKGKRSCGCDIYVWAN